ncbi:MAG: hypothetical protein GXP35_18680, partial [Actinobacteria bacterium]|nr:hypothetical protein [Actinomycetota bacterium]
MTSQLGLRARLTLFVTAVFALAMSIASVVVLKAVEDDLVDNTRNNAETVLGTYLESIYGGTAGVGVVDAADTTRFFYRDIDGNEISEEAYFESIATRLDSEFAELFEPPHDELTDGSIEEDGFFSIQLDPDTGELLDPSGSVVSFAIGPEPVGEPHPVDLGDDLVAVAQTLAFSDGATVEVGVSSPLKAVTDSLDAIRRLIWIAVPALVAAI